MTPQYHLTDPEIRSLRDAVFGVKATDASWAIIHPNWSRPDSIAWLLEHASRPPLLPLSNPPPPPN